MLKKVSLLLLSVLLLLLCYPRGSIFWLAYVALVPFLLVLFNARARREVLWISTLWGFLYSLAVLYWLLPLYTYIGLWAVVCWILLAIFCALWFLLFAAVFYWLRPKGWWGTLLLVPLLWVIMEWLRTLGKYGISGIEIGYTQVPVLPLIQLAAATGVHGITFIIVLVNALLAGALLAKGRRRWIIGSLALVIIIGVYGWGAYTLETAKVPAAPIRVAVVQPNIDQADKLNSRRFFAITETMLGLGAEAALGKPDITLWPETAIPDFLLSQPQLSRALEEMVRHGRYYLLTGFPHYGGWDKVYNSAYLFSPQGRIIGRYDKRHLVPFGEYLPFRPILRPILFGISLLDNDYNFGELSAPLSTPYGKLGCLICFESTFPYIVRQRIASGADIIVGMTNDAWFANFPAPYQHINAGVMRAVENRTYFIQAANTGISAIVDPYGRKVAGLGVGEKGILFGSIGKRQGESFYSRFGEWVVGLCWVIGILYFVVWGIKKRLTTKYSH